MRPKANYLGYWDVKVQTKAQYCPREKHDEDRKCGILKVGDLDLHAAKLHSPTNRRTSSRRLEPQGLPIGRLNALDLI